MLLADVIIKSENYIKYDHIKVFYRPCYSEEILRKIYLNPNAVYQIDRIEIFLF